MNWQSRSERITRLNEKGEFERMFMPLSYAGAGIGFLLSLWQGVIWLEGEKASLVVPPIALFLVLLPLLLTLYRFLRGHFSKRLIA